MAVIAASVKEIWRGRGGKFSAVGKQDLVRMFQCETDNKADGPLVVATYFHTSVASLGSLHPDTGSVSYLKDIDPKNSSFSPTVWFVTLPYSKTKRDPDDPSKDPLEINITNEKQQVAVWALNSAGDLLDPPPMRDSNIKVVNVTLTVGENIPTYVLDYEDAVNTDSYTIGGLPVAPFRSKCSPFDVSTEESRLGAKMRVLKFSIQVSKRDIRVNALDQGFRERNNSGKLVNITNEDGSEITRPALLDNGSAIADPTPADRKILIIGEDQDGYSELPFLDNLPGCV